MKRVLITALAIILLGAIVLVFKFFVFGREGSGGLEIDSSPKASVFIDGIQMGITPYSSQKIKPGEHLIRLMPEGDSSGQQLSWEGKVIVSPIVMTAVKRAFGETEDRSSILIISLEKIPSKKTSAIAVVSSPNNTTVRVDGETKGFSPVSLDDLPAKSYEIVVSAAGYEEKSFLAKTIAGYKVLVQVQLARKIDGIVESTASAQMESGLGSTPAAGKPFPFVSPKATPSPGGSVTDLPAKPYVTIKDTPNGFLRVRSLPSITGAELAKVKTGAQLPYLNEKQEDANKDIWYKVEYKTGQSGWVSGSYVELSE